MSNLIEHILNEDYVSANELFESHMEQIAERKLFEAKRMYASRIDETFGALTKADIEARKKSGYKKASEVLGDPREKERKSPRLNPKAKIIKHKVSEEALDEAGLGYGARVAHAMTPSEKKQYMSAMKGSIGSALKLRKSILAKTPDQEVDKAKETKRPGIIARNLNTLAGREPGYKPEPKKPEQEGGRAGKFVRGAVGGAVNLVSRFGSEVGWVE